VTLKAVVGDKTPAGKYRVGSNCSGPTARSRASSKRAGAPRRLATRVLKVSRIPTPPDLTHANYATSKSLNVDGGDVKMGDHHTASPT